MAGYINQHHMSNGEVHLNPVNTGVNEPRRQKAMRGSISPMRSKTRGKRTHEVMSVYSSWPDTGISVVVPRGWICWRLPSWKHNELGHLLCWNWKQSSK